jgi:di/tricarboxylate transporter
MTETDEKKHIFENPKIIQWLWYVSFSFLVLLLVLEVVIHKHAYFSWEDWPGFYAIFGFVACVLLALVAKYILRPLLKREEDYYD